jgi:hypothetical protein
MPMFTVEAPIRGHTAESILPQKRREGYPGQWWNDGEPISPYSAEKQYLANPKPYDDGNKRFCLLVPMTMDTRVHFIQK